MSRDDDWEEYDRDDIGEDHDVDVRLGPGGGRRRPAVTAIGVVSIVVGSLGLLAGLCMVVGVVIANTARRGRQPGNEELVVTLGLILASAILLWSIGLIVGGIGVLARGAWARMLTLVLAGFGLVGGIACLIAMVAALASPRPRPGIADGRVIGFLFFFAMGILLLGHGIWAFIALVGGRARSEFR